MSDEKDKRLDSEEEEEWDTGLVTPEHQVNAYLILGLSSVQMPPPTQSLKLW